MSLNQYEQAILKSTELAADKPLTEVADDTGISVRTAQRTVQKLIDTGIITRKEPQIDLSRLGMEQFCLCLSVSPKVQKERTLFLDFLSKQEGVCWIKEVGGEYDYMINLISENPHEILNFLNQIGEKFPKLITENKISRRLTKLRFPSGFLGGSHLGEPPYILGKDSRTVKIDPIDYQVINVLSTWEFESFRNLAQKANIPAATFMRRIQKLREKKVFLGVRYCIKTSKLALKKFKVLVSFRVRSLSTLDRMKAFCSAVSQISCLTTCLGAWDYKLELVTASDEEARQIGFALRGQFADQLSSVSIVPIFRHTPFPLRLKEPKKSL